jgi:hypothetical protein
MKLNITVLLNGTYCFVIIFSVDCADNAPIAADTTPSSLAPNRVLKTKVRLIEKHSKVLTVHAMYQQ